MSMKTRLEKLEKKLTPEIPKVASHTIPYTFDADEDTGSVIQEYYQKIGFDPEEYDIVINNCFVRSLHSEPLSKHGWEEGWENN